MRSTGRRPMTMTGGRSALPEIATRLADRLPLVRLDPAVRAWVEGTSRRGIWSVAFSGGADSLALLLLLWAHWPSRRKQLRALHFDHRLRGAASRADRRFCAQVCAALGVTFLTDSWKEAHTDASEAESRAARMGFLSRRSRCLWLGHQQDDVAESMLMRLARGSGTGGLAAPRPVQSMPGARVHLRPLLTLKKTEIIAALRAAGARWREDASNKGDDFFRNRIRRSVLPVWTQVSQRDALGGAARSRQLLEEDDIALEAWVDELLPAARRDVLPLAILAGKPRAVVRRALHRWLLAHPTAGQISRAAFDALLSVLLEGKATRHSLGREGFAVTDGKFLRFQSAGN